MRLIDADALIVSECRQCDGDCHCFDGQKCLKCNSHNKCQLREAIDYADTINAVPVVRCKDCWKRGGYSCPMFYDDEYLYDGSKDDGFCHHGARMDEVAE